MDNSEAIDQASALSPTPVEFKIGDRVQYTGDKNKSKYNNRLGIVHKLNADICLVKLDGSEKIFQFPYDDLEILDPILYPPPASPKKKKPIRIRPAS
jgi:hypothetical protein